MMDLASTLQGMRQLIAQLKRQQSSGPIQAGTSCNDVMIIRIPERKRMKGIQN